MHSPMERQGSRRKSAGVASGASPQPQPQPSQADAIKVLCRFRPPKKVEIEKYGQADRIENFVLDQERGTVETVSEVDRRAYTFDKLFGIDTTQEMIFKEIESSVESIMAGFNGTVLAYGQTSSGKTHTMEGPSLWDVDMQGVIPRAVDSLFQAITDADEDTTFSVGVSYYEVYNEKVRDLLNPQQDDLKMREYPNKAEGWFIQDITETFCTDRESVIRLIETGKTYRATAATLMNADSSRSHSILSIIIGQKNEKTGRNRKGRLFLVDLAGSEKISKTGATGQTKKEAIGINVSLTTLGMVINALCDGSSHIPYRDSKLTLILKNSLGGNSKTTLIICCASESRHMMETVSTLRFGERAKRIKNNARVNEELGIPELKRMLQFAQKEIAELKRLATEGGNYVGSSSNIDSITSYDVNEASGDVEEDGDDIKDAEIDSLKSRIEEVEEELELERMKVTVMEEEKSTMAVEMNAYKCTIEELEGRVLEAKMISKGATRSPSQSIDDGILVVGASTEDSKPSSTFGLGDSSTNGLSLDTLRDESMQLKALLEDEITSLENSLNNREEEARSATMLAAEYAQKYANLKEEFDSQIQRLVLKLSLEQQARADVEERIDSVSQQLWSAQNSTSDVEHPTSRRNSVSGKKSGFFSNLFGSTDGSDLGGHSRFSMLLPSLSLSREREMQKRIEHQTVRLTHLTQELESTKEAQRIVLDTKESVMRSLLKQNSHITQERDVLAKRVEDLAATVEQLTGLLRNIQNRKQQKADPGNGDKTSAGPPLRRFSTIENQYAIHGGGGGGAV